MDYSRLNHNPCEARCSSIHLKSLYTLVLADFEQQFIPAVPCCQPIATTMAMACNLKNKDTNN
jgi:hypothetical protein